MVARVVTQSSIGKLHRVPSKQAPLAGSIGQAPLAGSDVPSNEPTDHAGGEAEAEEKDDKSQSLTQQLGNIYGFRRLLTEEQIARASFEDLVKDGVARKPFKLDVDSCLSYETMQNSLEDVLAKETIADFHASQDYLEDGVDCATELMSSVAQASNDVINHWKGKARIAMRKTKIEEQAREKEQLKQLRDDAAQKAKDIKEKNRPSAGLLPLFLIDYATISSIRPIVKYSEAPGKEGKEVWSRPFILANHEGLTVWLGDSKVQTQLTKYGSSYKKELPVAKLATILGRTQKRVDDDATRQSMSELLDTILPDAVDISDVEGGNHFMEGHWYFGCMPHPDMSYAGYAPNSAACVKIMSSGKVRVLLVKTSTLVDASQKSGPLCENLDYVDAMRNFPAAKLTELCAAGAMMYHGEHISGELLFVPQGWLLVESSSSQSLTFGYRKSFMQGGAAAVQEYKMAITLFKASARDTVRMTQICEKMETANDEA